MNIEKDEKLDIPSGAENDFALSLENVSFTYADGEPNAVDGVSLCVPRGQFLAVLGHNGSGKSTLAKLICGLLSADYGKLTVWDFDPSTKDGLNQVRTHVGVVFQNPDNQTVASIVEDDIAFGPENLGLEREEIGKRITWALKAVGMEEYRNATPSRLSGGQKQRIAVAGVLAIKPDILILDESTAMLDPQGRRDIISVAERLNREEGMTVILITHFTEEAMLASRAIVMDKGKIVEDGAPTQIFALGDGLKSYNLCPPAICEICRSLRMGGLDIPDLLTPKDLAKALSKILHQKEYNAYSSGDIPAPIQNGEWDINIKNLSYTYSKKSPFATRALDGVNLSIPEGEFFGVIGRTGSGKSTLIQHLNGLIKLPQLQKHYKKPKKKYVEAVLSQPSLTIGGYDLSQKKCSFRALRADVGMVFQYPEYQLFADTVFADVAFGLKNFNPKISDKEVEEAVRASLEIVGLNYEEVKDKSPFELSGGQKRRAAIAGVIVTKPKILVLDEPAAGLDPLGKKDIMRLLHSLHSDWCKTVIIVSHDMDEIAENCTAACIISKGKIVACDKPEKLFTRGEDLAELGLELPLTGKIKEELAKLGVKLNCGCTQAELVRAIIFAARGGENA